MSPTNNDHFLQLLRDFRAESSEQHKELVAEIKDVRKSLDSRLDVVESKLQQHDHRWNNVKTIASWVVPSGSIVAVITTVLSWINSVGHTQAK